MTDKEKSELQKLIVSSVGSKESGRLLLAPRIGKTKIGIDIIKRDKPKSILWVTPSAKLAAEDIPQEFKTWKAKTYLKSLTTTTWKSLPKVVGHFDLIFLDEEQAMTPLNSSNLISGSLTGRIITLTGTPTKHAVKLFLYSQLKLKVLYKLDINEAVSMGVLSDYSATVIQIPLDTKNNIEAGNRTRRWMTSESKQYDYLNAEAERAIEMRSRQTQFKIMNRMHFIKKSHSKLNAAKWLLKNLVGRKLVFASNIAQAEEISDYVFHSKTDDKDYVRFANGEIDEIAMVDSGGIGHTYKAIDHLILVQTNSDKNGLATQKIARTLLSQKDYKARIWILSLMNTKDETWVDLTLNNFNREKVEFVKLWDLEKKL